MVKKMSSPVNRRNALRTLSATAAGLTLPLGSVLGSKSNTNESVIVSVRKTGSNALSPDNVLELQKDAVEKFRRINDVGFDVGKGKPASSADIVALSYYIAPNGVPFTYAGAVPDAEEASKHRIDRLHKRANNFEREVTKSSNSILGAGLVGGAKAGDASGWDNKVANTNYEYDDCPYGVLYMSMEVYEEYDGTYWGYGGDHIHRTNPGANSCSSDWKTRTTWIRNYWDEYDAGDPQLEEYVPQGDKEGNYTVTGTVGYNDASISVSYDPPAIYRDDTTDDLNDIVKLDWEFDSYEESPYTFNPTSQMEVSDDAEDGNRLLKYLSGAEWIDSDYNTHTTESDWYVYK